jgi:hypothetical protein
MDKSIKLLKEVEADLLSKLEESPIFRQLESLRKTISTFELNGHANSSNVSVKRATPLEYDAENFTWRDRIKFVIAKLGNPSVSEIIQEIQKLEPNAHTKAFLDKRIGVTVSQLKKKGDIKAKQVDGRFKYFI